jgi:signal peptidase I
MRALLIGLTLAGAIAGSGHAQERRVHSYVMPSTAMEPTLREGERVMADRRPDDCGDVEGIMPGDIIVRRHGDDRWIHRVMAGPGQTFEMRDGIPVLDGRPVVHEILREMVSVQRPGDVVREPLPDGRTHEIFRWRSPALDGLENVPAQSLGPDEWFVLGDHRHNAVDSRSFGPVPSADVCGIVTHLFLSSNPSRVGPLR